MAWAVASAAESVMVIMKSVAANPSSTKDQEFPAPTRHQPLQHGDGSLAAVAFAGDPAVYRQCAEQGHGDQDQGRERRDHARGQGRDSRLVAQG